MTPRVTADLLLVGSVPATSTEEALRAAAANYADLVFALPDGETGPRSSWVGYERERLVRPNPSIETIAETTSPTGIPRHMYETPVFGIRPGVTSVHWDSWPRIDDAIASWEVFRALRDAGVIPAGLRFQVGLPFPVSALNGLRGDFAADYPVAFRGYADLVSREMSRLTAVIPPSELAIQWDIAYETLDIEGVLSWSAAGGSGAGGSGAGGSGPGGSGPGGSGPGGSEQGAWERYAEAVDTLPRLVPSDVLVGYHLCYGTFPEWPMYEARDMSVLVRMANYAFTHSGRPMDWVHMAGPRYLRSEDASFFEPLAGLSVGDARVFLGIVLPLDGEAGLRRRSSTAARFLPDFGVALYCGFRVPHGYTPQQAIEEHRDVVRAVRRL